MARQCPTKDWRGGVGAPTATIPDEGEPTGGDTVPKVIMGTASDGEGPATYLRLIIENEPAIALLDTGSEVTLLPASVVSGCTLKPVKQRLYAANGTEIRVLGEVEIAATAGSTTLVITGLVSDQIFETILGEDFLSSHAAVWDFVNEIVTLDGVDHRLCARGPRGWCRRVVLCEETEIPARSEVTLPTRVVFNDPVTSCRGVGWMTEVNQLQPGVCVARTLLPDRSVNVPVRVLNANTRGYDSLWVRCCRI